jgi:transposase-like protein
MSKEIKKYNSDFKFKVVMKYLSENYTIYQICSEYDIAKSTLHKWVNTNSLSIQHLLHTLSIPIPL